MKYICGPERLAEHVDRYRGRGLRIVFTNGCFDILHRGHITYLNQAKDWATCSSSASTRTRGSAG